MSKNKDGAVTEKTEEQTEEQRIATVLGELIAESEEGYGAKALIVATQARLQGENVIVKLQTIADVFTKGLAAEAWHTGNATSKLVIDSDGKESVKLSLRGRASIVKLGPKPETFTFKNLSMGEKKAAAAQRVMANKSIDQATKDRVAGLLKRGFFS